MEEAGRRHRVVQIVGDGVDGDWLTWRWNDPYRPVGVHRVERLRDAVRAFRAALPREPDSDRKKNRDSPRRLATSRTVSRQEVLEKLGLYGPLTRYDDERKLMRDLSRALLPDDLCRQLIEATAEGERVEVRVAPSPPDHRITGSPDRYSTLPTFRMQFPKQLFQQTPAIRRISTITIQNMNDHDRNYVRD